MKLLLTNVVYGELYTKIFLDHHLVSLLDESNLPRVKRDVSIILYTDAETQPKLQKHPRMLELLSMCEVEIRDFTWRANANRFGLRYQLLINTFRQGAEEALKRGAMLSAWTADMVIAKDVMPKLFETMGEGFDAVMLHPARATFETIHPELEKIEGALYASDLYKLCHTHLHPFLAAANHWKSPTFTKYPFYIHWNTGTGMLTRSFATTPIIMRPTEAMKDVKQVIDIEVPAMFENPYWADDFDDFGVIQLEPVMCYADALTNFGPQKDRLTRFAKERHPHQRETFKRRLYYPNRLVANVPIETLAESDLAVKNILEGAQDGIRRQF